MSDEHVRPDLDMLADYLEGLLSEQQRAEVERAVAEDPSTAALLAELEGLPALLAGELPEPMPADVAARIDAALKDEAASSSSAAAAGKVAPVRSLPTRRRRWLAPALVAAAAVGVVGLGSQAINSGMDGGSGQAESAMDAGSGSDVAAGEVEPQEREGNDARVRGLELAELSADSFSEDVADALRQRPQTFARERVADYLLRSELALEPTDSVVADGCAAQLPPGRVLPVRLDGEASLLVLSRVPGQPGQRDVLAYPAQCPAPATDEGPDIVRLTPLARTRLPFP